MKFEADLVKAHYESPLGPIVLAASVRGLAGLWFDGQRHQPAHHDWQEAGDDHPVLTQTGRALDDYFAGRTRTFEMPLDLARGTPFQQSVWRALQAIPAGSTQSYRMLAEKLGSPGGVRAVGAAVGKNPISIIVPCHRVLGHDGSLTGYAGGLPRKTALLALEGVLL